MGGEENCVVKRIALIVCLLLPVLAHAAGHMFEAGLHGGLAGWSAKRQYIGADVGFHAGGHLYYNYISPYVIGFRTGLTVDCHNAGFGRNGYEDIYSTVDVDDEQMDIFYSIGSLRERYTLWSVAVPLQLAWNYDLFTLYTGAKAVFPMNGTWRQTLSHAALSVYYPAYDNRIDDSYPLAASRDFDMHATGKFEQPAVQWWLALELDYALPMRIWSRKSRPYIIVGVYFEYDLTGMKPVHTSAPSMLMLSDTRDGLPLQRMLTPVLMSNRQGTPLVSSCGLWDVGIKISYAISSYTPPRYKASRHCTCEL